MFLNMFLVVKLGWWQKKHDKNKIVTDEYSNKSTRMYVW